MEDEILDLLRPETAVISVGRINHYDHLRREILERLSVRNIRIKRTDLEGDNVFELGQEGGKIGILKLWKILRK